MYKEVPIMINNCVNTRLGEILCQPSQEIDAMRSQVKIVSSQLGVAREELMGEINRLKNQSLQASAQSLLKSDKTEVEALGKRLDMKLNAMKQEWTRQTEAICSQIVMVTDSVSSTKTSLLEDISKSSKSLTKKQDILCEKLIEVETRMCQQKKELCDQTDELLKLIKNSQSMAHTAIQSESEAVKSEIENLRTALSAQLDLKLTATDFAKAKRQLKDSIATKASSEEVNLVMEKFAGEINSRQTAIQSECEKNIETVKRDLVAQLRKRTTQRDVEVLLGEKVSINDLENAVNPLFKRTSDIEERVATAEKKQKLRQAKLTNLITEEIKKITESCTNHVTPGELNKAIERKANLDEVNTILSTLKSQIDSKAETGDIQKLVSEQEQFNEFFATESIIARYKWKSGQFGTTPFVPLEVECLNTLKENFIWEKNATSLMVLNGGLYEVAFGFFSKQKPSAKLYFNNEVVCTVGGPNSQETTKQLGTTTKIGAKDREKEREKPFALQRFPCNGLTSFDYYLIPDNCKVSLYVIGEAIVEGFINIRRL